MAEITTTQSFADGDTVTAAKLNNIIANASVGADLITNRSELLTIEGTADLVLVYDDSASGLRKVKANNLVQDGSISSSKIADGSVTNAKLSTISPSPEGTYGGASSIPTIVVDNKGRVTNASTSALTTGYTGFRNRIINGDMRIDQRNAGASFTPTNGGYGVDRFGYILSQASKITSQRSTTAPAGFSNSLLVTSSAATSVDAGEYYTVFQAIEGFNIADLGWGTASAKSITILFWVRSSLTGTFGGSVINQYSSGGRYYQFTYTINAANTWEQKTVTITGDTSGSWATDNTAGLYLSFSLGVGSTYSATAGSWGTTYAFSPTGATQLVATNGATFYITGVQLEAGSTATDFERRPYGTELALCQRYYEKSYALGTTVASNTAGGLHQGVNTSDGNQVTGLRFLVSKRSAPTVTVWSKGGTLASVSNTSYTDGANTGSWNPSDISEFGFRVVVGTGGLTANSSWNYHYRAESEL